MPLSITNINAIVAFLLNPAFEYDANNYTNFKLP